jgi:thioredoxin-like negative regulator of GroEL
LPVIDTVSGDYADEITFVAIAWNESFAKTEARAKELLTSGNVIWGLDEEAEVFNLYGVSYQPVSVLVANGKVIQSWRGAAGEEALRVALDNLALFGT